MSQACLTQYFTPKQSRRSTNKYLESDSKKSQKRKLKFEEENNENVCSSSTKKRRISPSKPTDGYLPDCDLDQIDKLPLSRQNRPEEKKIQTFERQKVSLTNIKEIRQHLSAVRTHLDQVKSTHEKPPTIPAAHERFAHLLDEKPSLNDQTPSKKKLESPADIRRYVQTAEHERVKKILSKVDQTIVESLPITPSKKITGINNRLLEQIRLKEQSRQQLTSLENTGVIQNDQQRSKIQHMFKHMKEFLNIIDQLFTTERQVALETDRIREKIIELHSARFNQDQANEHLDFLLKSMDECAPNYLISLKLRNKQYIKINRAKTNMDTINEFLEKKFNEYAE